MLNRDIAKKIAQLEKELSELKEISQSSLNFSNLKLEKLREVISLERSFNDLDFQDWFNFEYKISQKDRDFLSSLLNREKNLLKTYNEEELKANFLIPIFNRIDFRDDEKRVRSFYEQKLSFENGNFSLNGTADFIVGRGFEYLETPIFFIQEFKKGVEYSNPEPQLLAEMVAGLEISKLSKIRGAYIVGAFWNFAVLRKVENRYIYSISDEFNSKKLEDLELIYKNLLFVKSEIIESLNNR